MTSWSHGQETRRLFSAEIRKVLPWDRKKKKKKKIGLWELHIKARSSGRKRFFVGQELKRSQPHDVSEK